MVSRHLKIWAGLLVVVALLANIRFFAPLSGTWDKLLGAIGIIGGLTYACAFFWEDWRKRRADQSSSAAISSGDQI